MLQIQITKNQFKLIFQEKKALMFQSRLVSKDGTHPKVFWFTSLGNDMSFDPIACPNGQNKKITVILEQEDPSSKCNVFGTIYFYFVNFP